MPEPAVNEIKLTTKFLRNTFFVFFVGFFLWFDRGQILDTIIYAAQAVVCAIWPTIIVAFVLVLFRPPLGWDFLFRRKH